MKRQGLATYSKFQSLLIQGCVVCCNQFHGHKFSFEVSIPSYSGVCCLAPAPAAPAPVAPGFNPFLFRGVLSAVACVLLVLLGIGFNPFLFRGVLSERGLKNQ